MRVFSSNGVAEAVSTGQKLFLSSYSENAAGVLELSSLMTQNSIVLRPLTKGGKSVRSDHSAVRTKDRLPHAWESVLTPLFSLRWRLARPLFSFSRSV